MLAGSTMPCQWIEASSLKVFATRSVTVSPSRQRNVGAGTESFTDLGSGQRDTPAQGEVIFIDDVGLVGARRWCWRQSAESAASPTTTEVLVTVEGHHEAAAADVAVALVDLETLLRQYAAPGELVVGVVDRDHSSFAGLGDPSPS